MRLTRRQLLGAVAGSVAAAVVGAAYARWIEPEWIRVEQVDLPVAHLPPAWNGLRVGLIADLHHSPRVVPLDYLDRAIGRLQSLRTDLVAVAGDFVNTSDPAAGERVAGLFDQLVPPLGVFACLGNHDYGIVRPTPGARRLAVADRLREHGVRVLCNEAVRLRRAGEDLWITGVDDFWADRSRPETALAGVPPDAARLILCHNPDAADAVEAAGGGSILAGHAHGGQVRLPWIGPLVLPVRHRDRAEGLHRVGRSWLYVNRGIGWLIRVRLNCRPELSVLTLRRAN